MKTKKTAATIKTWQFEEVNKIYNLPLNDLIFSSHKILRKNFNPNKVQVSILANIKKGKCYENCAYCSQSAHHKSNISTFPLLDTEKVLASAKKAKSLGATRFCMAAAWRAPKASDMKSLIEMVTEVKKLGLETCLSAGLLTAEQAKQLKKAGLDFYNHNIDTSEDYYPKIITTRKFSDRLKTVKNVADADISVCCGGIIGMGENQADRIKMIITLANMHPQPKSVPINLLVKIPGTPLEKTPDLDPLEIIRIIAITRILIPKSYIRLSAGRTKMTNELQALCFFAGANSIFYGDELLTTPNPTPTKDLSLLNNLGITAETA
ncbi:MAG: biotin synthase BioB [Rickettsiales bacterium]|nr:biotin synthase BioB [Rickettsiales bacterium]